MRQQLVHAPNGLIELNKLIQIYSGSQECLIDVSLRGFLCVLKTPFGTLSPLGELIHCSRGQQFSLSWDYSRFCHSVRASLLHMQRQQVTCSFGPPCAVCCAAIMLGSR